MEPESVERLLKSRDGKDLADFIKRTIFELNSVFDIDSADEREIALEVLARKRANEKLLKIFTGFQIQEKPKGFDPKEYAVE